jgi:hypothetical protein
MRKSLALVLCAITGQVAQTNPVVAEDLPNFDIRKSCRADVSAYGGGDRATGCIADEQKARATLVAQWNQFAPDSRNRCVAMENDIAGAQSYVELLSCLQTAKIAPR